MEELVSALVAYAVGSIVGFGAMLAMVVAALDRGGATPDAGKDGGIIIHVAGSVAVVGWHLFLR